ncbi:MAG: DUF2330 domain-containing protein [Polyangiaceae bacterium]
MAEEPFDSLETFYPFQPPEPQSRSLEESKSVAMPTDTAVTVHEVKRIGSFTAFVLSATDAKALDQWFTENEIARPPNAVEWLAHFVDKKFFLTAFRYEPPEAAGGEIEAETVRLSFKTPDAYYPYIEPLRSDVGPNRHLAVWTVAESPLVPAALFAPKVGGVRWDHAWSEGMEYKVSRDQLARTLPGLSPLLPAPGSLVVQTFMDHRSNRNGVSDVIFANAGDDPGSPEFRARAAVLIGSLDKLLHTGAHTPDLEDSKPAVGQLYPMPLNRGCACDMAASSSTPAFSGLAALAALAAVLHGRRRRRPAS